ncbi:MAG: hypothetical protein MSA49_01245 [Clostridia bacterium]|nr:hypothetical protein [Clostridia bacterium]
MAEQGQDRKYGSGEHQPQDIAEILRLLRESVDVNASSASKKRAEESEKNEKRDEDEKENPRHADEENDFAEDEASDKEDNAGDETAAMGTGTEDLDLEDDVPWYAEDPTEIPLSETSGEVSIPTEPSTEEAPLKEAGLPVSDSEEREAEDADDIDLEDEEPWYTDAAEAEDSSEGTFASEEALADTPNDETVDAYDVSDEADHEEKPTVGSEENAPALREDADTEDRTNASFRYYSLDDALSLEESARKDHFAGQNPIRENSPQRNASQESPSDETSASDVSKTAKSRYTFCDLNDLGRATASEGTDSCINSEITPDYDLNRREDVFVAKESTAEPAEEPMADFAEESLEDATEDSMEEPFEEETEDAVRYTTEPSAKESEDFFAEKSAEEALPQEADPQAALETNEVSRDEEPNAEARETKPTEPTEPTVAAETAEEKINWKQYFENEAMAHAAKASDAARKTEEAPAPSLEETELFEQESETDAEASPVIDETDRLLLKNLGYRKERPASATKNGSDTKTKKKRENDYSDDVGYDYGGGEFVYTNQKNEIRSGYQREKKHIRVRWAITGVATLLLLIYEILTFSGVTLPGLFNPYDYPVSHCMISLQLLVICLGASVKPLAVGFSDLCCLRATPYSVSAVVLLSNIVYTVILVATAPNEFLLYNFMGGLSVFAAVTYEYFSLLREEKTFSVLSTEGARQYAFLPDEAGTETLGEPAPALRAYMTDFHENYFERNAKRPADSRYLSPLLLVVSCFSVVAFAMALLFTRDVAKSAAVFVTLIDFALPVGVTVAYSFPLFWAARRGLGDKGAVIGQGAMDEYEGTRFVTFDEEDLFPSLKTTHIDLKPAGNRRLSEVLAKTSLMFSAIGGPLARMVEAAGVKPEGAPAEIHGVFDNGISAFVDGSEMLAGSARFLELHGVELLTSEDERDVSEDNEILYIAIDGELAARYYLQYRPAPDFVKAVNLLGNRGIAVGIRTKNPAINSDIVARRCPRMQYKIYTIKSFATSEADLTSYKTRSDSSLCAIGRATELAYPLMAALDIKKYYKADRYIRVISTVVGALVAVSFALFGLLDQFNAVQMAIYQAAWTLPTLAYSFLKFSKHR